MRAVVECLYSWNFKVLVNRTHTFHRSLYKKCVEFHISIQTVSLVVYSVVLVSSII
jgi:hypothetical protein